MSDGITLFRNNTGSGSDASSFLKDAFSDFTIPATSNTGFTSSASTNPLGYSLGNDETTKFGTKTLYVKDIKLVEDRSKWVNNKPTYEIIWNEDFPSVRGFCYGNIDLMYLKTESTTSGKATPMIVVKDSGTVAVTSIARRVGFINMGQSIQGNNDQLAVDGSNTTTTSYQPMHSEAAMLSRAKYIVNVSNTSDSSRDIHTFTLTQNSSNVMSVRVFGVVVFFSESAIDQFPGSSYVNKSKITASTGTTFSVPTFGSSLGGNILVYKNSAGYTLSAMSATTIQSVAIGSSGTNLLTVTSGTGSSFLAGYGVIVAQGTSNYFGMVQSISTDTLTVFPTLSFGISNSIYRYFYANGTAAINASMFTLKDSIDFSKIHSYSLQAGGDQTLISTMKIFDGLGKWAVYGAGFKSTGIAAVDGAGISGLFDTALINHLGLNTTGNYAPYVRGAYSQGLLAYDKSQAGLSIEGRFSALELECVHLKDVGVTQFISFSCMVNGLPGYSTEGNTAGIMKFTVFTEGSNGFNQVRLAAGNSSSNNWFIQKINIYDRNFNQGVSYGRISHIPVNQAYTDRGVESATTIGAGVFERLYGHQLYLQGPWALTLATGLGSPGFYNWSGSTTTCVFKQQYYGSKFSIIGLTGSAAATLLVDGVQYGATLNIMHSVALGFHEVVYQIPGTGLSTIISAFDYVRPNCEIENLQKYGLANDTMRKKIKIPVITEWTPFPYKIRSVSGGDAYKADVLQNYARWRRVGDTMELEYKLYMSGAGGAAGSGAYLWSIPQGFEIDGTKTEAAAANTEGLMYYARLVSGSTTSAQGSAKVFGPRDLNVFTHDVGTISSTVLPMNNSQVGYAIRMAVPILGWEAYEEIEVING